MTAEDNPETGGTMDSLRDSDDKDLAAELSRVREELNRRATAAEDQQEENLYRILGLRLAETERHLSAMTTAREPASEFSFQEILDGIDEELVAGPNGAQLELPDQS